MKKERVAIIDAIADYVYFHTLLLIIYLSAIERRICRSEMSLKGATSFGLAQNTMHNFQKVVLNS